MKINANSETKINLDFLRISPYHHLRSNHRCFQKYLTRILLLFLLLQAIWYLNIKFHKYEDYFKQPEKIRLKRKTNETQEKQERNKTQSSTLSITLPAPSLTRNRTKSDSKINNQTRVHSSTIHHEPPPLRHTILGDTHPNVESFSFYLVKAPVYISPKSMIFFLLLLK